MSSLKLFRLALPFVVFVTLIVGASASAVAGNVRLYPVGDEPGATGAVHVQGRYTFKTYVSCQGLTPGAAYSASVVWFEWDPRWGYVKRDAFLGSFVADQNGTGSCRGGYSQNQTPYAQGTFRVHRSDGTTVLSSSP